MQVIECLFHLVFEWLVSRVREELSPLIIANFQKSCGLPARDEPPLKPAQFTAIPAAGEESARAFLKRVDAQVGELMFG